MLAREKSKFNEKISGIKKTTLKLTGRAGLAPAADYIRNNSWLMEELEKMDSIKGCQKGTSVHNMLIQIICYFFDGTSLHITRFDELKKDPAYGPLIGVKEGDLCSSGVIHRLLRKFSFKRDRGLRKLFDKFFIKRLKIENPPYIVIDVDSVVFDNRYGKQREGVEYTYKKVCGFHPLLFKWNGYVIDLFFRRGSCHTNHGDDTSEGLKRIVKLIRKKFDHKVPIIVTMDGGYMDKKLCRLMEDELKIGYIVGGKAYKDLVARVLKIPEDEFTSYKKDDSKSEWLYTEFYDRRASWQKERRTIVSYQYSEENQLVVKCGKDLNILYTNLGEDPEVMAQFEAAGVSYLAETHNIVMLAHNRGDSELTHRHIKDFGGEKLPCENFESNEAYFMMMLLSFNLHQAFKRDCCEEVMEKKDMYPKTCRRQLFDLPGIIVKHANKMILKVADTAASGILQSVWSKAQVPI